MTTVTRDRIVAAGLELFQKFGFGQVGLDQVMLHSQLTKTTFYNHFESKEHLIREVLDLHQASVRRKLADRFRGSHAASGKERLLAVFDLLEEIAASPGRGTCLMISAIAEHTSAQDPIHRAALENNGLLIQLVRDLAADAGARNPEELGRQLATLWHGAALNGLLSDDQHAAINTARRMAATLIAAAIG